MQLKKLLENARKSGRPVVVAGLGKSGIQASLLLKDRGYPVVAIDDNVSAELLTRVEALHQANIEACLGISTEEKVERASLLVVSPGIPPHSKIIKKAVESKVPVVSELDLAWALMPAKPKMAVAVTGTNGKTTVTTLLHFLLEKSGQKAILAGNVGDPLSAYCSRITSDTTLVLEVSSFQLYFSFNFTPDTGAILNITPDHFDWHKNFRDYIQAKRRLIALLKENGRLVLNLDDPIVSRFRPRPGQKAVWFTLKRDIGLADLAYQDGSDVVLRIGGKEVLRVERNLFKGIGNHNTENLLATVSLAWMTGLNEEQLKKYLPEYQLQPHRLQEAARLGPIVFIDDSKATNSDAARRAIESFSGETLICLLGGKPKEADYSSLAGALKKTGATAVVFGEARNIFCEQFAARGIPVLAAENLEEAVETAFRLALSISSENEPTFDTPFEVQIKSALSRLKNKVVVLLAPACASFDEFNSYHERGEKFREYVLNLIGKGSSRV